MKMNKWITLLVLITIGGIFNGCASIDKLNQLTAVYNESKGKIQDLRIAATQTNKKLSEYKDKIDLLDKTLAEAEPLQEAFMAKWDKDGNGKIDGTERADPTLMALVVKAFATGDWKTLLLLIAGFLGLHIGNLRAKLREYVGKYFGMGKKALGFASYNDEDLDLAIAEKAVRDKEKKS